MLREAQPQLVTTNVALINVGSAGNKTTGTIAGLHLTAEAHRLLRDSNWKAAIQTCQEVLAQDPKHLGALEVMAQAQWFAGDYEGVIESTTQLLHINPSEPGYRYTRGMAYLSKSLVSNARQDFLRAIGQSSDDSFCEQVTESLIALDSMTLGAQASAGYVN